MLEEERGGGEERKNEREEEMKKNKKVEEKKTEEEEEKRKKEGKKYLGDPLPLVDACVTSTPSSGNTVSGRLFFHIQKCLALFVLVA